MRRMCKNPAGVCALSQKSIFSNTIAGAIIL